MNPKIAKPLAFFAIFAIIIGAGCSIGWNFFHKEYFSGICSIVLVAAAIPTVIKLWRYLNA